MLPGGQWVIRTHCNCDLEAAYLRRTVCHANLHSVIAKLSGSSGLKSKGHGPRACIVYPTFVIDLAAACRLLGDIKKVRPARYRSENPHLDGRLVAYKHINRLGGGCEFYRVLLPEAI